jgi:hypothetical protein
MAYKINRDDEFIVEADGLATVKDVNQLKRDLLQKSPEFYELEPAEVIEVYLDKNDEDFPEVDDKPDWSKYGWITARMMYSSENVDSIEEIRPLDTNIKEYPLPGEVVIVVDYFGDKYYTQKLNIHNSVNINSHPGLSKWSKDQPIDNYTITDFENDSKIRQLEVNEGDITFNGRFGQSIRFGSNVKEVIKDDKTTDVNTRKQKSPNIIIRAGQADPAYESVPDEQMAEFGIDGRWKLDHPDNEGRPVKENINLDKSSIWVTTDQVVPLKPSVIGRYDLHRPEKFEGNQIILNSDRLVFNTKLEDINFYSKRSVNIIAEDRIVLEGHGTSNPNFGIFIGGADVKSKARLQPILAGDQMMKLFKTLIDKLMVFSLKQSFAQSSFAGKLVYLGKMNDPASELYGALSDLSTRMEEPKSRVATVLLDQDIGKIISEE